MRLFRAKPELFSFTPVNKLNRGAEAPDWFKAAYPSEVRALSGVVGAAK